MMLKPSSGAVADPRWTAMAMSSRSTPRSFLSSGARILVCPFLRGIAFWRRSRLTEKRITQSSGRVKTGLPTQPEAGQRP